MLECKIWCEIIFKWKYAFTFNLSFSFTSDIYTEIIATHNSQTLDGLITIDPGIADLKFNYNMTLLHYAVAYRSSSCVEVLLKLAPRLFDVVETTYSTTPLQYAKKHCPDSIEVITMLERHLINR